MERRVATVEAGRTRGTQESTVFGSQYQGNGNLDFQRLGSPIRRRLDDSPPQQGSRNRGSSGDRDVFSKSEKWLPAPPEPKCEKWTNRESEIEGFFSYVQALRAWSQLASDKMASEIQAIRWQHEIVTSTLTQGQQSRSARLFALLKVAFASHVRIDSLIRAYEAGCAIHNSPAKPYGSCGYELLRILALEFSLRTRTEAICLRAELLKREFRVDAKGMHVVSDLIRVVQVAVNRFDRLVETLPPEVARDDLRVGPSDLALLFIRNLPHEAKQYCLLHSENESWEALQSAALKYERQQRLYVELGAFSKRLVNEVAVFGTNEDENATDETVSAVQQQQNGCSRCGKKGHDSKSCKTNLASTKCFKCGQTGHIGRNCRVKPVKGQKADNDGKGSSQTDEKAKAKAAPKGKGKGGSKGKGKMFEVGDNGEDQADGHGAQGGSASVDVLGDSQLQMALLGSPAESFEFDVVYESFPLDIVLQQAASFSQCDCGLIGELNHCGDASWYEGLLAPAPSSLSLFSPLLSSTWMLGEDLGNSNWWLVESGASVTVLSEKTLVRGCFVDVSDGSRFFAANGTAVNMKREVTLKAFISLQDSQGSFVEKEIRLSALVGETSNNILSTTQLVDRGWQVELGKVSKMVHVSSGKFAELESWAGCPWVFLQGKRGAVCPLSQEAGDGNLGISPVYRGVVRQTETDEMHRARGHVPFDPNCAVCQQTRSVTQHRRKRDDGASIIEMSADFFFLKEHKFLVICERFSGMVGCVWMDPNTDHVRAALRNWLQEMGCFGNEGVLSVFTDDEQAVGAVFTHLRIGKDVKVTKAPPQGQAMNGLAERSVRSIKESFLCVSEELQMQGLEVCNTGPAVSLVLEYVCFMLNCHASVHGSSKTPQEFLTEKTTTRPLTSAFGAVVLCELPASLQTEDRPRFVEGAFLRPEFNSKSCLCMVCLEGVIREVRPKSIKFTC